MPEKTRLKNGLRVITVSRKNTKAVTLLVLVAVGSKYEKKKISGISHLIEHLLFKGTKKRPGPLKVVEPLDEVGGVYNAFTGQEYTGYYIKVRKEHFDMALDILSDIFLNSQFLSKEIKKEKSVVSEEIKMYHDHPMHHVQSLWNNLLYGDQPAGWDIAGTQKSVAGISRQEILDYFKNQYISAKTVVCAAGNFPVKEAKKKIEEKFCKTAKGEILEKSSVVEKQKEPNFLLERRKTDQTHLCLGVRGYSLFSPRRYAQEVLAVVLGGMMSSRLFTKVRQELGLAYYVACESFSDSDTGFLMARAGVDNENSKKAVSAIVKEFKKIKRGVPSKELKKAKENLKGKMALHLETSDALASFYGIQEIMENNFLTLEEIYDKINKVGAKDISELAKDIFKPENLNLALIGPLEKEKELKKILKI